MGNKKLEEFRKKENEKIELENSFEGLREHQKQFGEAYKPKWNFGFSRKCPLCGNNLTKIKLSSIEMYTYDTFYRNMYVCKKPCEYKYASFGLQSSGG